MALAAMLQQEGALAADVAKKSGAGPVPLNAAVGGRPDVPHHPARAKRVVQLFMAGAASHIDLFDFKPELVKQHGEPSDFGEPVEAFQNGLGPWMKPVWEFKPYGECGKLLGELVADLGPCVDEMAFVHNMVGKTGVHSQATLLQATGFQLPGFPGMGCWVSYGLGSLNDNLPTFVVLPDHRGLRLERHRRTGTRRFCPRSIRARSSIPARETADRRSLPRQAADFVTRDERSRRRRRCWRSSTASMPRAAPATRGSKPASAATNWPRKMQLAAPEALDLSQGAASTS